MTSERTPQPRTEAGQFAPGLTFSQAVADELCERLANGEPVKKICTDPRMPDWTTLRRWRERLPVFAAQYARAREASAEAFEEEAIAEAFKASDRDNAQAQALRVQTLKWAAAIRQPRVYGEKQTLKHETEVTLITPEQRRRRIAELQAKLIAAPVIEGAEVGEDA